MTLEVRVSNHTAQNLIPKTWVSRWWYTKKLLYGRP